MAPALLKKAWKRKLTSSVLEHLLSTLSPFLCLRTCRARVRQQWIFELSATISRPVRPPRHVVNAMAVALVLSRSTMLVMLVWPHAQPRRTTTPPPVLTTERAPLMLLLPARLMLRTVVVVRTYLNVEKTTFIRSSRRSPLGSQSCFNWR